MKGFITEIISSDLCVVPEDINIVYESLHDCYPNAEININGQYIHFYLELKNLEYTYYPQTYYEPEEWDCDEWIYEEDFQETILQISNDLGIDIDVEKITCEQKERD